MLLPPPIAAEPVTSRYEGAPGAPPPPYGKHTLRITTPGDYVPAKQSTTGPNFLLTQVQSQSLGVLRCGHAFWHHWYHLCVRGEPVTRSGYHMRCIHNYRELLPPGKVTTVGDRASWRASNTTSAFKASRHGKHHAALISSCSRNQ